MVNLSIPSRRFSVAFSLLEKSRENEAGGNISRGKMDKSLMFPDFPKK